MKPSETSAKRDSHIRALSGVLANKPYAPHGERHDEAANRRRQRGVHRHLGSQAPRALAHAEGAPAVEAVPPLHGATHQTSPVDSKSWVQHFLSHRVWA